MSSAIGILGGTFDPPHRGHLAMAQTARERIGLDRVFLAPAALPPHKNGGAADTPAALAHRMAMVSLVAGGGAGIDVYRDESPQKAPSFTADLLRRFREQSGATDIYFIVGADSFRDLPTWKDPADILAQCTLVVFPRDEVPLHTQASGALSAVIFEGPRVDVSSRGIRARVARGESIVGLVPDGVAEYIVDHGLYRAS